MSDKENHWISRISTVVIAVAASASAFSHYRERQLPTEPIIKTEQTPSPTTTSTAPPTTTSTATPTTTVTLPPATELPTTLTFSRSGVIDIEGAFTIQVQDVGLITFDPATGDRTLADGTVRNTPPERNHSQFSDPTKPWGVLLIRQEDSTRWVPAEGFEVNEGARYVLGLNVNLAYQRYVTYRPRISLKLYSE